MENKRNRFEVLSNKITNWTGSSTAFIIAFSIVVIWIITGPIFKYSDTWQLVINTGTTIVTFLMVFLIQKSQNKDGKAIQLKLDELITSNKYASNKMVDIECLTEEELDKLRDFYTKVQTSAQAGKDVELPHSIDQKLQKETKKIVTKGIKKAINTVNKAN